MSATAFAMKLMRETFVGCCALAITATASSTTTNRSTHHSLCITRMVEEKSEIYDEQTFVKWEEQI